MTQSDESQFTISNADISAALGGVSRTTLWRLFRGQEMSHTRKSPDIIAEAASKQNLSGSCCAQPCRSVDVLCETARSPARRRRRLPWIRSVPGRNGRCQTSRTRKSQGMVWRRVRPKHATSRRTALRCVQVGKTLEAEKPTQLIKVRSKQCLQFCLGAG